jgi:hypothetical protein
MRCPEVAAGRTSVSEIEEPATQRLGAPLWILVVLLSLLATGLILLLPDTSKTVDLVYGKF